MSKESKEIEGTEEHGAYSVRKSKSAQATAKSAQGLHRLEGWAAKTSAAYWLEKVQKPAGSAMYGVQIAYQGERGRFPLETADKKLAAERARARYVHLVAHGWAVTKAKFKPGSVKKAKAATVGALIEAATRLSSARRESLDAYAKALRRLTAGVLEIGDGSKYDFRAGSLEWREKVDKTPLDKLTPGAVVAWKNAFLKAATKPEERKAGAVTVNSLLRNSKALLSKKVRPFIEKELALPEVLWFDGVPTEKEPSLRYHSQIDAGEILGNAAEELAGAQPEVFKALLLTLVCGLRRSEADALMWSQMDLEAGTLELMDTEHKTLKSADSAGKIALDAELVALLRGMKARAGKGVFVLETPKRARVPFTAHQSRTYRCDATFKTLVTWLQDQGVPGHRPIHTLRKEIGSVIASRDGIFAASRYLRHSDIRITSKLYADTKTLVSAGLGALLKPAVDNVVEGVFTGQTDLGEDRSKATAQPRQRRAR
jgi:integrase